MLIRPADMVRTKAPEADLRRQYAKTFWSCFGISALLLAALIVLFPDLDADAYSKSEKVIIQIEDIPETRQERRPPPPPRPVIPIASQSDDIPDDATIMETDLDFGLEDLPPPPPLSMGDDVDLEEEEEEIVEIWRVEKQPVPVNNPSPKYPEIARKAGITATWWSRCSSTRRARSRSWRFFRATRCSTRWPRRLRGNGPSRRLSKTTSR